MQILKNRAFSIIEILIVIVIVVVFVVIAYPQVTNYLADREVKTEVNKLIVYIEEKKSEAQSNKYPIIVIGFYQNMQLWQMPLFIPFCIVGAILHVLEARRARIFL